MTKMNDLSSGSYLSEWDGPQCSKCLGTGRSWNHKIGQWSPYEDCELCEGTGIQKNREADTDVMMVDCAGGCKQKVLSLSFDSKTSWCDQASYFYCLECRAKQVKTIR